jgi:hypothetical protein
MLGLGATEAALKLKADGREAEIWPCLSGLCTEAAVVAGAVGRQNFAQQLTWTMLFAEPRSGLGPQRRRA